MLTACPDIAFVENLAAWSTLAAALATSVSVGFIAWQIRLTRKSVEATESALRVAREEFEHSRVLRNDAQRAAIDSEMPKLTVEVTHQSSEVWRSDFRGLGSPASSEEFIELEVGHEFTTPRDDGTLLQVRLQVSVSNDGPRRAVVSFNGRDVVIKVGETYSEWVTRTQPLSQWIEIAKDRQLGNPGEEPVVASLVYIYPGDAGAIEVHEVIQGGTFVEPIPDNFGGWRIRDFARTPSNPTLAMNAVVNPFTRKYWMSRKDERPL